MKILTFLLFLAITSCAANEPVYREERDQPRPETRNQTSPAKTNSTASSNQKTANPDSRENGNSPASSALPQNQDEQAVFSDSMGSAKTDEEKAIHLEEKLDGSLREFDDMLLKKNQDITQRNNQSGGSTQTGSAGNGGMSRDAAAVDDDGTKDSTMSPNIGSGHKGGGTMEQKKEFDNDDVVARQIREAAEKETDPELKEKLWNEYRKYKSGNY